MTTFIPGEMQRRIKYGFRILLPETYELRLFGEKLKLSHILAFPQAHFHLCLILDLSYNPDEGTPSVNNTTNMEAVPELLQFGRAFPLILQADWEADPAQDPFQVSKLDVPDVYHRVPCMPLQVGAFAQVVPSALGGKVCIIYIYLVPQIGWVESPKFFYAFS